MALAWTRRIFFFEPSRARPPNTQRGALPATEAFTPDEREWMRMHVAAVSASFAGWFVCAQFASIGYYWTLYYLLALIVAGREVTIERIAAARFAVEGKRAAWKERLTA
jgi:hypothetical protein